VLSDTALGTAFTLLYALVGLPLGRLADSFSRTRILSIGVLVWSLLTATSGVCKNFSQLFVVRLGVGLGEASCAPAASSLIGDLFPAHKRSNALSIFMLGLPIGIAHAGNAVGLEDSTSRIPNVPFTGTSTARSRGNSVAKVASIPDVAAPVTNITL
jgi:MFS family permease